MKKHEIKIDFEEYNALTELSPADYNLCLEAAKAMAHSHSPYSRFRVGAALKLKSGRVVYGSNQENAAFPSGLCAERVALFHWGATYPEDVIESMAITAHTHEFALTQPITPCGSCLQVIAEYEMKQNSRIRILLHCPDGPVWIIKGVKSLLPFLFFENRLVTQV